MHNTVSNSFFYFLYMAPFNHESDLNTLLTGLGLIRDLTGGQLEGASLGSSLITFRPGVLQQGYYVADTKTAGAVCLLAQISLPVALFSPGPVSLQLQGGTNCDMAPQIDEFTEILLPNLKKFGVNFEFEVVRKGFFPKGGGEVNFFINPVKMLHPIMMTDPGRIERIYGWSFCAGNLPLRQGGRWNFYKLFNN